LGTATNQIVLDCYLAGEGITLVGADRGNMLRVTLSPGARASLTFQIPRESFVEVPGGVLYLFSYSEPVTTIAIDFTPAPRFLDAEFHSATTLAAGSFGTPTRDGVGYKVTSGPIPRGYKVAEACIQADGGGSCADGGVFCAFIGPVTEVSPPALNVTLNAGRGNVRAHMFVRYELLESQEQFEVSEQRPIQALPTAPQ